MLGHHTRQLRRPQEQLNHQCNHKTKRKLTKSINPSTKVQGPLPINAEANQINQSEHLSAGTTSYQRKFAS